MLDDTDAGSFWRLYDEWFFICFRAFSVLNHLCICPGYGVWAAGAVKADEKKLLVCLGAAGIYLVLVILSKDVDQISGWFGFAMLAVTLLVLLVWNWCHAEKGFLGKQLPPSVAGWLKKYLCAAYPDSLSEYHRQRMAPVQQ